MEEIMNESKVIDIKEFLAFGYLQEVNRQFLHPLGLALSVNLDEETGVASLGGIWDSRDDLEGFLMDELDETKAVRVQDEWNRRQRIREEAFGNMIQPLEFVLQ